VSPAERQLFGLGDALRDQVQDQTEELKRRRQAMQMGRADLAGLGGSVGGNPISAFMAGGLR
jgi:hypothetical protein